jgi:type II secretory pathway component PulF
MAKQQLSPQDQADLIWVCRRLASVLQDNHSVLAALDAIRADAPRGLHGRIGEARRRTLGGARLPEAVDGWGLPRFAWEAVALGDRAHRLPEVLRHVADRLEAEQVVPASADRRLYDYSLAFGRIGLLLLCGVELREAVAYAAESVSPSETSEVLLAAQEAATNAGLTWSEAVARLAPDLPALTVEMIHDAEEERRLGRALLVVSDYLLEEAGHAVVMEHGKEA